MDNAIIVLDSDSARVAAITAHAKAARLPGPILSAADFTGALTLLNKILPGETAAAELNPLMVITALNLPPRTGFEILAWASMEKLPRRILFVGLDYLFEPARLTRASEMGAAVYLSRTPSSEELGRLARQALRHRRDYARKSAALSRAPTAA